MAQSYIDGSECKENAFRKDITKIACLMLEEGIGETTFLHKSIAEYHAAAFVKSSDDDFALRFYAEAANEPMRWRECLSFLASIDQYRYAKMFSIKHIDDAIKQLELLCGASNSTDFLKKLPNWTRNLKLIYGYDSDGGGMYTLESFGSWTTADNLYCSEISGILSTVTMHAMNQAYTNSEIEDLKNDGFYMLNIDRGIEIPLASVLNYAGLDDYKNRISILIDSLKNRHEKAKKLSAKLSSRPAIFDLLKKTK